MMFITELSNEDDEMLSMYNAAAIETRVYTQSLIQVSCDKLISDRLPCEIELQILHYLPLPDLMKSRLISRKWCYQIENMKIAQTIKDEYFRSWSNVKVVQPWINGFVYRTGNQDHALTTRSLALYMQMKGNGSDNQDHNACDCDILDYLSEYDIMPNKILSLIQVNSTCASKSIPQILQNEELKLDMAQIKKSNALRAKINREVKE